MKYIITSELFIGEIIFGYDSNGRLCFFELGAELNDLQFDHLIEHFPIHMSQVKKLESRTTKIKEVKRELTFDAFWTAYDYKLGTKLRAQKIWNSLSEADKAGAMDFIRIYEGQRATTGHNKMLAETYLSNKRWNNNK